MNRALLYCVGGGIGDSLMASVAARALRARFSAVDALVLRAHVAAMECVPDVDEVLADDGGDARDLAAALAKRGYAACVVTWATARAAAVASRARIPIRVGQARRLYSWRFTKRVPVRSEFGDVTSHWTQIVLDYARALGCDTGDAVPAFVPKPGHEHEADELLASLGVAHNFGIVHPANAIASRRAWPTAAWTALARQAAAAFGTAIVISGGSEDSAIAADVAAGSNAIAIAGKLSIGGFAALARRARFFAGITTGAMHVAAAVGCPTVGLFPFQTDFPERWAPLGRRTSIVRATYPCRPGERKETCPDYACIAHLDVPRILAAIRSL